jgi:hypothetical protein
MLYLSAWCPKGGGGIQDEAQLRDEQRLVVSNETDGFLPCCAKKKKKVSAHAFHKSDSRDESGTHACRWARVSPSMPYVNKHIQFSTFEMRGYVFVGATARRMPCGCGHGNVRQAGAYFVTKTSFTQTMWISLIPFALNSSYFSMYPGACEWHVGVKAPGTPTYFIIGPQKVREERNRQCFARA